jgi:hypothetical protein
MEGAEQRCLANGQKQQGMQPAQQMWKKVMQVTFHHEFSSAGLSHLQCVGINETVRHTYHL